jgi:hypothetical protein
MRAILLAISAFLALSASAQPGTRIDLTELESPPDTAKLYFITTEGDTARYTADVLSIDSSGRVFTIVVGGDTIRFEDQSGGGGNGLISELPAGDVNINANGNDLTITNTSNMALRGDVLELGQLGTEFQYPTLSYHIHKNAFYQVEDFRAITFQPRDPNQTYPFIGMAENSRVININDFLVDTTSTALLGDIANAAPPADGYAGYSSADSTLAVYVNGVWRPLALESGLDSTRLIQDSILVYYQNGLEAGRDTVRLADSGGPSIQLYKKFNVNNVQPSSPDTLDVYDFIILDGTFSSLTYEFSDFGIGRGDHFTIKVVNSENDSIVMKPSDSDIVVDPPGGKVDSLVYSGAEDATFVFAYDGIDWHLVSNPYGNTSGSGSGGSGGAFSTTSNVTSNAPGTLGTDDFVFGSDQLDDDGTLDNRFFFDKSKAAFYAGEWTGTEADDANRGFNTTNLSRNSETSAYASAAIGGQDNVMQANGATAVGCDDCEGDGNYSVVMGRDAKTDKLNQFSQGNASFDANTPGQSQFLRLVAQGSGTNTDTFTVTIDGISNQRLTIPDNTLWNASWRCALLVSTAGGTVELGDHKASYGDLCAKNISGTVEVDYSSSGGSNIFIDSDNDMLSAGVHMTADNTNNAMRVQVVPSPNAGASTVTRCTCTFEITQTSY